MTSVVPVVNAWPLSPDTTSHCPASGPDHVFLAAGATSGSVGRGSWRDTGRASFSSSFPGAWLEPCTQELASQWASGHLKWLPGGELSGTPVSSFQRVQGHSLEGFSAAHQQAQPRPSRLLSKVDSTSLPQGSFQVNHVGTPVQEGGGAGDRGSRLPLAQSSCPSVIWTNSGQDQPWELFCRLSVELKQHHYLQQGINPALGRAPCLPHLFLPWVLSLGVFLQMLFYLPGNS